MNHVESKPTEAGIKAVAETLEKIKQRSFAQRNNLGKMIKCSCGRRHRQPACKMRYVKYAS